MNEASGTRPWLTRNVVVLSGVSFLQDAASELVYPILPIFLTVQLGAPVVVVGLIEGIAEGASSVTKAVAGGLSDGRSRRPFIGVGYGAAALGKVVIALANVWPLVLVGRVVDRLGKGLRAAPRDALLMDGAVEGTRGRVFGLHRAADTAGAVVGPLLGLGGYALLRSRSDLRPLFMIAVVPAVLSVLLVTAVRESPGNSGQDIAMEPARPPGAAGHPRRRIGSGCSRRPMSPKRTPTSMARTGLSRRFWRVTAILSTFSLLNFPDSLLLLRAHELGLGVAGVVLAYVLYNTVYAIASFPAGALSDHVHPSLVFALGLMFFAVGYVGLGIATSSSWVWVVLPVYGGFTACTDGVGKAWIAGLVTAGHQGSAQGTYQALTGGAIILAGLWSGLSWGNDGERPLLVSGFGALLVAVAVLTMPGVRPTISDSTIGQRVGRDSHTARWRAWIGRNTSAQMTVRPSTPRGGCERSRSIGPVSALQSDWGEGGRRDIPGRTRRTCRAKAPGREVCA